MQKVDPRSLLGALSGFPRGLLGASGMPQGGPRRLQEGIEWPLQRPKVRTHCSSGCGPSKHLLGSPLMTGALWGSFGGPQWTRGGGGMRAPGRPPGGLQEGTRWTPTRPRAKKHRASWIRALLKVAIKFLVGRPIRELSVTRASLRLRAGFRKLPGRPPQGTKWTPRQPQIRMQRASWLGALLGSNWNSPEGPLGGLAGPAWGSPVASGELSEMVDASRIHTSPYKTNHQAKCHDHREER